MTAELELAMLLLTSFVEDQFYRKADATADRIRELVAAVPDKAFAAKAALYARREAGMRSATHLVAAELARHVKGAEWTKRFFERIVLRVDDATEILACHLALHGKPLPNALKKGLGAALAHCDAYQLAKYRGEGGAVKLVDAVNLLHPPHSEALAALVRGGLAPAETWETRLTRAGQEATDEVDKAARKAEAWTSLVRTRKIGYFALLRNLRNLLLQAPELIDDAVAILTDKTAIRRSLVMPFRFRTALDAIEAGPEVERWKTKSVFVGGLRPALDAIWPETESGISPIDFQIQRQKLIEALSVAADLSLANVPRFEGRTLVAVDTSGSMMGRPLKIASLFAAVIYKANRADLMLFSDDAHPVVYNRADATLTLAQRIEEQAKCGGTNFHPIFDKAADAYDRIVILSDMQAWVGYHTPAEALKRYVKRVGKRPRIFSFDLAGYGTLQFPQADVYALAGFSDKTMETLRLLEQDKTALLREIQRVEL